MKTTFERKFYARKQAKVMIALSGRIQRGNAGRWHQTKWQAARLAALASFGSR